MMTVTVEPETRARIDALVEGFPAATMSGVVEELLVAALPAFEQVLEAIQASRDEAGELDEAAAKAHMSAWVGGQIMKIAAGDPDVYNTKRVELISGKVK
jgi:predicted alpha/beta-hydrolase family hydrolase